MVYITGDIHRVLSILTKTIEKIRPAHDDLMVLLGDVGVNFSGGSRDVDIKTQMNKMGVRFFCIHGNHENRPQNIDSYVLKDWHGGSVLYEEQFPNLLFPVDGDIFELEGKQCLVIGGAYSVDKHYRLKTGRKWWADEQPSPEIKAYVEEQIRGHKVDVVFSHTCPFKYIPTECFISGIDQSMVDNSTEKWLDTIEEALDYKAWYLGHWHINKHIDKMHFLKHEVEMLK